MTSAKEHTHIALKLGNPKQQLMLKQILEIDNN
jgi:hypothetical protein